VAKVSRAFRRVGPSVSSLTSCVVGAKRPESPLNHSCAKSRQFLSRIQSLSEASVSSRNHLPWRDGGRRDRPPTRLRKNDRTFFGQKHKEKVAVEEVPNESGCRRLVRWEIAREIRSQDEDQKEVTKEPQTGETAATIWDPGTIAERRARAGAPKQGRLLPAQCAGRLPLVRLHSASANVPTPKIKAAAGSGMGCVSTT